MIRAFTEILTHTPIWIFALLAYLMWQGVQSLKERKQPVWRVLIVPLVFFLMGMSRLVLGRNNGWEALLAWVVAALLFAALALYHGPRLLAIDRDKGRVTRPGSPVTLIRNVTIFLLQYGIAVSAAMHLDGHLIGTAIGRAVSRATAGYFAGWTVSLLRSYRKAEINPDIAAS